MRIRIPRRILLLGTVLALLCALPAVTPSTSVARPFGWDPRPLGDSPTPPSGDGDGTIVKARYVGGTTYDSASKTSTVSVTGQKTWSIWRTYLLLVRQGVGIRWIAF